LSKGEEVIGIDNFDDYYDVEIKKRNIEGLIGSKSFSFYNDDICDIITNDKYRSKKFDVIIHLAAKVGVSGSIKDPQAYIEKNIRYSSILLDWMRISGNSKLVFASSSSVYGRATTPFSEKTFPIAQTSPYGVTKLSCELMNRTYHYLYGINIVNLRFFTVYGPRMRPDLAIYKFSEAIKNNKPITLFGDGESTRDYTYIDDITNGIISSIKYILDKPNCFETFNLGNNDPVKLKDMVAKLGQALNKKPLIDYHPFNKEEMPHTCANIEKAQKVLSYNPVTDLDMGLEKFVNWFQNK
jgi:UDP-glucuronate 4-epimerase